jgi:hypothetical protein
MAAVASVLGILLAFSSMWFAWYLLMPGQHDEDQED